MFCVEKWFGQDNKDIDKLRIWGFGVWFLVNVACVLAIGVVAMRETVSRVFAIGDLASYVAKFMYTSFLVGWAIGYLMVYQRDKNPDYKYIISTLDLNLMVLAFFLLSYFALITSSMLQKKSKVEDGPHAMALSKR